MSFRRWEPQRWFWSLISMVVAAFGNIFPKVVTRKRVRSSLLVMNATDSEMINQHPPRLQNRGAAPKVWSAMLALQQVVNQTRLEPALLELVKIRASQLNRCAFCLDMHVRDALARGEKPERVYLLDAWEEVDIYSPREQAALLWSEVLTRLSASAVSDEVFARVRAHFTEAEMLELTLALVAINGWNRLNVGFRIQPGAC